MKYIRIFPLLLALMACETERNGVQCIGINDTPEPDVRYEYSTRNIIIGAIFVEMIFPPVLMVLNDLRCPVED